MAPAIEELLQKLIEQQILANEQQARANALLESLSTKAYNAEMRQCHSSGESTDVIRMSEFFYRAESALLSSHTQRHLVQMMYDEGGLNGVEYHKVFGDKDTRRAELATVIFYKTFEDKIKPYNIFESGTEHMHALLKYMPSFRKMALENAKKMDMEVSTENREQLSFGPYTERIKMALGPLPEPLHYLHELVLPLNKQHQPIPKITDEDDEPTLDPYESLPKSIKATIEAAQHGGLVSREDKSLATTQLVVKWCSTIAELSDKQWEIEQDEYFNKKREAHAQAEDSEKRLEMDKNIIARIETACPEYTNINKTYEELQAKKASEKAAKQAAKKAEAEASGEQEANSPH